MVAGPQAQSPAFDPVEAGAMLRRTRLAAVRQKMTNSFQATMATTTTIQRRQSSGAVPGTAPQSAPSAAPSRGSRTTPRSTPPASREFPTLPVTPPKPYNPGANRIPTPQQGQSFDEAHAKRGPRENEPRQKPTNENPGNFPTVRPNESIEQARARELHRNTYKPSPPLQTPPPSANTSEESATNDNQAAAQQQLAAAEQTNDFAAQARARGAAARAATKAKNAAGAEGDEQTTTQQTVGWLYSLLFQGGGAVDELGETGGIVATAAETGNLYQTILTILPSFSDKMDEGMFADWLPKKFDLANSWGRDLLSHFGEWGKAIAAGTEMLLYVLAVLLLPFLLGVMFAFITHPLLGLKAFLSTF